MNFNNFEIFSFPLILAVGSEKRGFSQTIPALTNVAVFLPYGKDIQECPLTVKKYRQGTFLYIFEISSH